ncbi:hypothetical protein [Janthinobacterium aquaticum]|uniref:hypothetical protein n=1 Tax=Janthinobacterium sp. FT58W TaxID=2654254 RepID=UPI001263FFF7|nr:hypothetical protein [Janthinobacterium sp. FT58W]KAB8044941.1 hypothetical protein GCM43_00385 [Janthinobacterium sp. FT58W]
MMVTEAIEGARWFSAVGTYTAQPGQLAVSDLQNFKGNINWLPTSRDQPDPIHGDALQALLKQGEPAIQAEVLKNYRLTLQSLRTVPDGTLRFVATDFTEAAKGAALYCVRMATLEMRAGCAGFWVGALEIYRQGNWPCALLADGTLLVY